MTPEELDLKIEQIQVILDKGAALLVSIDSKGVDMDTWNKRALWIEEKFKDAFPDTTVLVIPDSITVEVLPPGEKVVTKLAPASLPCNCLEHKRGALTGGWRCPLHGQQF